jgi:putative endonuclease
MPHEYYVYILTNKLHSSLYTGVTGDLSARIHQHAAGTGSKFTGKYRAKKLVYVATFDSIQQAIEWEKTIKAGSRQKKIELIVEQNPNWNDLSESL